MHINPTDTAAVQASFANEPYEVAVIHNRSLVHLRVVGQELRSPARVADEKLPVHEVVGRSLVATTRAVLAPGCAVTVRAGRPARVNSPLAQLPP